MKASVIINEVDIAELGVFILRGGDHEILTMPERIEPAKNNWYEYNGLDVDLSEIFFNARTLPIQFYISAKDTKDYQNKLFEFNKLIIPSYTTIYSREFDRSFKYRYLSVNEYKHKGGLYKAGNKHGTFTVNFSMDDPVQLFKDKTILQPRNLNSRHSHIILNGIDLGDFGIIVNEFYNSALKQAEVKAPLTVSFERWSGLLAFPSTSPRQEAKEITINCTMRAKNRDNFYYNYEALFNQLTIPKALELVSYLGTSKCYYSKMDSFKKIGIFSQGVMVQFSLKLIQI